MEIPNNNLKDKTAFYGFRKSFIRNASLSPEARLLLIILFTHKGKNPYCWPSVGTLSKELHRNPDSVRRYTKELKTHGYLLVETRGIGRSLLYTPSYWKISAGIPLKSASENKPPEKTIHQPTENTLNLSISSRNKDKEFKIGKELFDQTRKKLKLQ